MCDRTIVIRVLDALIVERYILKRRLSYCSFFVVSSIRGYGCWMSAAYLDWFASWVVFISLVSSSFPAGVCGMIHALLWRAWCQSLMMGVWVLLLLAPPVCDHIVTAVCAWSIDSFECFNALPIWCGRDIPLLASMQRSWYRWRFSVSRVSEE